MFSLITDPRHIGNGTTPVQRQPTPKLTRASRCQALVSLHARDLRRNAPGSTHVTDHLVGGWYDSELTEQGERDAERTALRLAELIPISSPPRLVTSNLRRAQQTAAAIARAYGIAFEKDSDLRERSYGEADGRAPGTTVFNSPPADGPRMDHHPGTPGTETRGEWASRVYRALRRVQQTEARQAVIVTHGGTLTYRQRLDRNSP